MPTNRTKPLLKWWLLMIALSGIATSNIAVGGVFGMLFGNTIKYRIQVVDEQQHPIPLSVSFPYLLVIDDHDTTGNNPNIVDLRTGEIVFKSSGFGAMWMSVPHGHHE